MTFSFWFCSCPSCPSPSTEPVEVFLAQELPSPYTKHQQGCTQGSQHSSVETTARLLMCTPQTPALRSPFSSREKNKRTSHGPQKQDTKAGPKAQVCRAHVAAADSAQAQQLQGSSAPSILCRRALACPTPEEKSNARAVSVLSVLSTARRENSEPRLAAFFQPEPAAASPPTCSSEPPRAGNSSCQSGGCLA